MSDELENYRQNKVLKLCREAQELCKPSELAAPSGSVSWVNYEWDSENPACVRCGATMCLNDGCEWDDDPSLNLCHDCALALLREMKPNDDSSDPRP